MSKILVVDDNTDHAESLTLLFQSRGHEVRAAHHGVDAIVQTQAFLPQIVFLDLEMPILDGFDAAAQIRALSGVGRPFIVALTGMTGTNVQRRVQAAGFDTYLSKPADVSSLLALVANLHSETAWPKRFDAESEVELRLARRAADLSTARALQRLVADTAKRCVELERAIGAMLALGGNESSADVALQASRRLLALYKDRLGRIERRVGF